MLHPWPLHCCKTMNQRNVLVIFFLRITTKISAQIATMASEISLPCLILKKIPAKTLYGFRIAISKFNMAKEKLIKNDADQENDMDQEDDTSQKADQPNISAIKEELHRSLLSIGSKLLSSEYLHFHHLSKTEQQLWNSFEKANIYEFLTGEKGCLPEFQFNWISPEAPAIC